MIQKHVKQIMIISSCVREDMFGFFLSTLDHEGSLLELILLHGYALAPTF